MTFSIDALGFFLPEVTIADKHRLHAQKLHRHVMNTQHAQLGELSITRHELSFILHSNKLSVKYLLI